MEIIGNQVLILAIISLIGYLAFKLKALGHEQNTALVRVIMKITMPLLLFTTVSNMQTNTDTLLNGLGVLFFASITVSIAFIIGSISGKLLKLNKENYALHKAHTMFGNIVFLGFPLLNALIPGGKGLLYATIFQIGHDTLMWTWGIVTLNKGKGEKSERSWKHLLNINTFAFALGFIFYVFNIKIPEVPFKAMSGVGHTTIYLSMVYVGAVLAQVKLSSLIKNVRSWILSFNKLLLIPILIGSILVVLNRYGILSLSKDAVTVIVLQAGMPSMIVISIIAREMGLNDFQATQNIFISTLLSMLTLPFLFFLLELFY